MCSWARRLGSCRSSRGLGLQRSRSRRRQRKPPGRPLELPLTSLSAAGESPRRPLGCRRRLLRMPEALFSAAVNLPLDIFLTSAKPFDFELEIFLFLKEDLQVQ